MKIFSFPFTLGKIFYMLPNTSYFLQDINNHPHAEKFTSEVHDPCARSRCLQKRTTQKHLTEGTGVEPANTIRRLSQKSFYNSRVLERCQSRVPSYEEDVGAFYSSEVWPPFLVEQVSFLQPKSFPCRASLQESETW